MEHTVPSPLHAINSWALWYPLSVLCGGGLAGGYRARWILKPLRLHSLGTVVKAEDQRFKEPWKVLDAFEWKRRSDGRNKPGRSPLALCGR